MTPEWIKQLNITDVSQVINKEHVVLLFKIEGFEFIVKVPKEEDGLFYPDEIMHGEMKICPLCKKDTIWCDSLNQSLYDFFKYLIESPSIRLEWLYIPHEKRQKGDEVKWKPSMYIMCIK